MSNGEIIRIMHIENMCIDSIDSFTDTTRFVWIK